MAKHVLGPNTRVTWNGTDLSDHISNVTLEDSKDEVEVTGFAESYKDFIPGLADATVTVTAFQDYGASSVDAVFGAAYYANAAGTIKITPDNSGTVVYTMIGKLYSFSPVNGGPGDANNTEIAIRNFGSAGLTRGTA